MILLNKTTGIIEYDGPRDKFLGLEAYAHPDVIADFEIQLSPVEKVDILRGEIEQKAGDSQALLGTTADATQLLLYGFCSLVAKLNSAQSLAEVRQSADEFAPLANSFLGRVQAGKVKLPFQSKGLDKVVSDIEARATAVATVLEKAAKG